MEFVLSMILSNEGVVLGDDDWLDRPEAIAAHNSGLILVRATIIVIVRAPSRLLRHWLAHNPKFMDAATFLLVHVSVSEPVGCGLEGVFLRDGITGV